MRYYSFLFLILFEKMAINVTSYPVLFLVFVIFGVMLLYQFHSNCEILKQNFQVDNFIYGFTLEEEQGKLISFVS